MTYKSIENTIRSVVTEQKQGSWMADTGWKKKEPTKTDKSGAVHGGQSRARHLAQMALKKKMKENFNIDMTDEQADDLLESIQKITEGEE
jgi:hypothetical protein